MEERSEATREPGGGDEEEDVRLWFDVWDPGRTMVARFEEDAKRAALYIVYAATSEPLIQGMVRLYEVAEWSDVQREEVDVRWMTVGPVQRALVTVRGRTRYVDVQEGDLPAGLQGLHL